MDNRFPTSGKEKRLGELLSVTVYLKEDGYVPAALEEVRAIFGPRKLTGMVSGLKYQELDSDPRVERIDRTPLSPFTRLRP